MFTKDYEFPQMVLYRWVSYTHDKIYYMMHYNTLQQIIRNKGLQRLLPSYDADINVSKLIEIIDELEKNKEVSENS